MNRNSDALGGNFTNCTYTFPVTNVTQFIKLGQVITTVGEGAFIGAIASKQYFQCPLVVIDTPAM